MKFACVVLLCLAVASTVSAQKNATQAASLADAIAANSTLSTLKAALDAAGLTPVLANTSYVATLFAPNNDAFTAAAAAMNTTADALLANTTALTQILEYHVVPGVAALSSSLKDGQNVTTLLGPNLQVLLSSDTVIIVGAQDIATVITPNIAAGKSVMHIVDTVLTPPAPASDASSADSSSSTGKKATSAAQPQAVFGVVSAAVAAAAVLGSLLL